MAVAENADDATRVWDEIEKIMSQRHLNDRGLSVLADAAFGYKIRRNHYMKSAEVSEQVASRELKTMVDHGLLTSEGQTKGRIYSASPMLREIYSRNYERRTSVDPFQQGLLPFQSMATVDAS